LHSRSEYARTNSPESASSLPMRLIAISKVSPPAKPAPVRAASWSRRCPSSSCTSRP
jgi:hypothetical protein